MEGRTHQLGGVCAGLAGCLLLSTTGTPLPASPLVVYPAVYVASMVGSKLPDQDHNMKAIPFRDPLGWSIAWLLHATSKIRRGVKPGTAQHKLLGVLDSRHRSWQTHSDFTLYGLMAIIWYFCLSGRAGVSEAESLLIQVVVGGTALGVLSHLILDAITPKGIWLLPGLMLYTLTGKKLLPLKFRLVPRHSFFATGGKWEDMVNKALRFINWVLFVAVVGFVLHYYLDFTKFFL